MSMSEREARNVGKLMATKVLESQQTCIGAGITLAQTHESFNKATPLIFRDNLKGLVSEEDLKIPHSELARHLGAAGKEILAFALTGTQSGIATYDKGSGQCQFIFGNEGEIFTPELVKQVNKTWEKRGPGPPALHHSPNPAPVCSKCGSIIFRTTEKYYETPEGIFCYHCVPRIYRDSAHERIHKPLPAQTPPPPSRDKVNVVKWEERDRLHIGIQDKETGDYYASWWDQEARDMFTDGFFKSGREFEESVLKYAEDIGILEK